jgi:hypothetical protein
MKRALLLAALLLAPLPAPLPALAAADESLLFTADELSRIREAMAARESALRGRPEPVRTAPATAPLPEAPRFSGTAALNLGAILYLGPDRWQIWLNGLPFTVSPGEEAANIRILSVTPGKVRLDVSGLAGENRAAVTLSPNQTYLLDSGRVVEGRPAPAPQAPPEAEATDGEPEAGAEPGDE